MNVFEYNSFKLSQGRAINGYELHVMGLPNPPSTGWLKKYGGKQLTPEMLILLKQSLRDPKINLAYRKATRNERRKRTDSELLEAFEDFLTD